MMIEGMVLSLKETTYNKRNTIEIQISKEDFDALMAACYLGDEYEICGKTVVISDEETNKEKCEILEMKVERLEKALKDLGYQPIYLSR